MRNAAILLALLRRSDQDQQAAIRAVAQGAEIGPARGRLDVDESVLMDVVDGIAPHAGWMKDLSGDRVDDRDFGAARSAAPRRENVMSREIRLLAGPAPQLRP